MLDGHHGECLYLLRLGLSHCIHGIKFVFSCQPHSVVVVVSSAAVIGHRYDLMMFPLGSAVMDISSCDVLLSYIAFPVHF